MKLDNIYVRKPHEKDMGFIYKSWLVNFRDSNNLEEIIRKDVYFENHGHLITKILSCSQTIMAANPEDPSQIFGYIVYQNFEKVRLLHYIYVKAPYRRLGIASYLKQFVFKNNEPIITSHSTRMSLILAERWNLIFNPYTLFFIG